MTTTDRDDIQKRLIGSSENEGLNSSSTAKTTTTTSSTNNTRNSNRNRSNCPQTNGELSTKEQQQSSKSALMKIKTYLLALRPWSLSASLVPTILGSAIAFKTPGINEFNVLIFLLTIFTVITVHGAGNVVNTYFDFVKGIDNRKSDDRTLVDHILSKDEVILFNFVLILLQKISIFYSIEVIHGFVFYLSENSFHTTEKKQDLFRDM